MTARKKVGLVGARGHVGRELVQILEKHAGVEVAFVVSQGAAGTLLRDHIPGTGLPLRFEDLSPAQVVERGADAVILALANGQAAPYVAAIDQHAPATVMVDVSADQRFNDAWTYGLPEHFRALVRGSRRVANPGCYATGAQVGLWPVRDVLHGMPSVFGVSGYSGAGSTPNPRNDMNVLRDNVVPYAIVGHLHEREIARHLGHDVAFVPHVAPFFRGMSLTITASFSQPLSAAELHARFVSTYEGNPLVHVQEDIPLPRDAAGRHGITVGGFAVHAAQSRAAWVVTLDNLLKGAATQAVQNLNLAMGFPELEGIGA